MAMNLLKKKKVYEDKSFNCGGLKKNLSHSQKHPITICMMKTKRL